MLAQQDSGQLRTAIEEGERAVASGAQQAWIYAHLADAVVLAGADEDALRFATAVDPEYFLVNDLRWRVVRINEIRAIALLRLGRITEGLAAANIVLADLVRHGEENDLPPPSHLVRVALTLTEDQRAEVAGAAREVLARVANALDLASWFPPSVVNEIRTARQTGDPMSR